MNCCQELSPTNAMKSNMKDTDILYFNFMEENSSESTHAYYIPITMEMAVFLYELGHLGNQTMCKCDCTDVHCEICCGYNDVIKSQVDNCTHSAK